MGKKVGKVYFVGAGPGDPGLLTLRGAQCLRAADVVLFDYLANPQLLAHARREAKQVCLGRHGHGRVMSQDEINAMMIESARDGAAVVRLKGGDPMVFGRAAEELAALDVAGVEYEIVPGVSAAQAASSYAGIPLTDRDQASCVAFVTGREGSDKALDQSLDYAALARFPGTLVFYMGVTSAPVWSEALMDGGLSPATPVAIIRRSSLADQATYFTSLSEVGQFIVGKKLRPPAIIVVGEVARAPAHANWFTGRALFGRTVLVTRSERQCEELADPLRALGANVLSQPAIEVCEPPSWEPVDSIIRRLHEFDWLVFSSSNGVRYFMGRLFALGLDARAIGQARLAAIGPGTVAALSEYRLRTDREPTSYRSESLAEALAPDAKGKRVFLARASRGREVLGEMLIEAGALVEQAVVYESRDVLEPDAVIVAALRARQIDWTTVTSSAIARSLVNMFGDDLRQTKLAAISPVTGAVLEDLGFPAAVVGEVFTTAGLVEAICNAERASRSRG